MGQGPEHRETVTIGRQGRLVIPARMREALALRDGQRVTLTVSDGELHISTVRASVDRARRALGITARGTPSCRRQPSRYVPIETQTARSRDERA